MNAEAIDTPKLMDEGIHLYIKMLGEKNLAQQAILQKEHDRFLEDVLPKLKRIDQETFRAWKSTIQLIHQSHHKNSQQVLAALSNREKLTIDEIVKAILSFQAISPFLETNKRLIDLLTLPRLNRQINDKERTNGLDEKGIAKDKTNKELVRGAIFLQRKSQSNKLTDYLITRMIDSKNEQKPKIDDTFLQQFVKELTEIFKTSTEREIVIQTAMDPYLTTKERQQFYHFIKQDPFLQQIAKKTQLTKLELKAYVCATVAKSDLPFKSLVVKKSDSYLTEDEKQKLKELTIQKEMMVVLRDEMNLETALRADKAFSRSRQRDANFLNSIHHEVRSPELKKFLIQRINTILEKLNKVNERQEKMPIHLSEVPQRSDDFVSSPMSLSKTKGIEELHKLSSTLAAKKESSNKNGSERSQHKNDQLLSSKANNRQEMSITNNSLNVFSNIQQSAVRQSTHANDKIAQPSIAMKETKIEKQK